MNKMGRKRIKNKFNFLNFLNQVIIYVGIVIFIFISLVTLLFTTQITQGPMVIEFAPIATAIGVALFSGILLLKPLHKLFSKANPNKLAWFVFWWGFVMSALWIFIANVLPMWDSADLSYAAARLNGDISPLTVSKWGPGGYMEHFPFQTPLLLLIVACMKVAGSNFVILFELLNCFACAFSLFLIVKITYLYFKNNITTTLATIFSALFIPLYLYCTFIYGNVLCLPFILLCWYSQKRAIELLESKKNWKPIRKKVIWLIILSLFCGGVSVALKGSMMVGMIASALVWLLWGLGRKSGRQKLVFIGITILALIFPKFITVPLNSFVGYKTKLNLNNGVPSIVWIAMGVGGGQEYIADTTGNEAVRDLVASPGCYDGLVWVSKDADYSTKYMNELAWKYLGIRVQHYLQNPGLAISFFTQKLLTEWTEPTFESFLASNWDADAPDGYNMAKRDYTPFARSFYYGKANIVLRIVMDILQTILALGILLGLLAVRKQIKIQDLAPILCILGTFILYIFWENKTQYMFPSYLFMIPFAAYGWFWCSQKIIHRLSSR